MSNDIKTLENAQPGGRVRLGDQTLSTSEGARRYVADFFAKQLRRHDFGDYILTELAADFACTLAQHLSAQPSPGGQGDSRSEKAATFLRQYLTYLRSSPRQGLRPRWCDVYEALEVAIEALAARQPVGQEPVTDARRCVTCNGTGICQNDEGRNVYCPDCGLGRAYAGGTRQPVGEPVVVAHRYIQRHQSAEHSVWLSGDADETYVEAERQGLGRIERAYSAPPAQAEPVGYFDPDVLAHLTEGLIDPVGVLRRKPNGKSNVPVWLGPPAQAVDLGPSIPSELAPVAAALKRFNECAEDCDSDGCDIGRDWFDALTTMGLLKRTQRSPAAWTMTAEGDRLLALIDSQAVGK
ncbi:hypothetical protein I5T78_01010 [Stenotrophomonas maltophilia]|nr:hypothetical protein [Stenotrophomonas maltophilia]